MARKTGSTRLLHAVSFALIVAAGHFAFQASAIPETHQEAVLNDVQMTILEEAIANETVPAHLALAVARVESNFDALARSPKGARGVMQIMPRTASGEFDISPDQLWDVRTNVRTGILFLEQLYLQYDNSWEAALSHYNGGVLKRTSSGVAIPHSYTQRYIDDVLKYWRQYERDLGINSVIARINASNSNWVSNQLMGGPDAYVVKPRAPGVRYGSSQPRPLNSPDNRMPHDASKRSSIAALTRPNAGPIATHPTKAPLSEGQYFAVTSENSVSAYTLSNEIPVTGQYDRSGIVDEMARARLSFRDRLNSGD
ncbi:MAG: lytic transglycosylase domain-containing protein [Pseudomonadota bacterium]